MGNTPTLKQWIHHRVRTIQFVSGAGEGQVEPASLTDLIYGVPELGIEPKVPNELIPIAEKVEFESITPEAVKAMSPEDRRSYQRFKEWLASDRLRAPRITPAQARDIPTDDLQQIVEVALHMDYPERRAMASFRELQGGDSSNGSGGHEGEASE
jgi:hypothetical protein